MLRNGLFDFRFQISLQQQNIEGIFINNELQKNKNICQILYYLKPLIVRRFACDYTNINEHTKKNSYDICLV